MRKYLILVILIFILITQVSIASGESPAKYKENIEVVSTSGNVIYFNDGSFFQTNLYDLKYYGQIKTKNIAPYLIISGKGSSYSDENVSLYVYSPADGPMKRSGEQQRFSFPGKVYSFNYDEKNLIYEAKTFYGEVLPSINGVIWYQKEVLKKGGYSNSAYLVEIKEGVKEEKLIKEDNSLLMITLIQLKNKKCSEIKGVKSIEEP